MSQNWNNFSTMAQGSPHLASVRTLHVKRLRELRAQLLTNLRALQDQADQDELIGAAAVHARRSLESLDAAIEGLRTEPGRSGPGQAPTA
jgi:hypothetical protein